jgi:hypothetical protein
MCRATSRVLRTSLAFASMIAVASLEARAQTWSLAIHDEVHDLSAENCVPNPCPTETRVRTRTDSYSLPGGLRHHLKVGRLDMTDNRANAANVNCFGSPGQWCLDSSSTSAFAEVDSRRIDVRHGRTNPSAGECRADAPPETASSGLIITTATGTGRIVSQRGDPNGTPISMPITWSLSARRHLEAACPAAFGSASAHLAVHLSLGSVGAAPAPDNPPGSVAGDPDSFAIDETQSCTGTIDGTTGVSCTIPMGARIGDRYTWTIRVVTEVNAQAFGGQSGTNSAKAFFDGRVVSSTTSLLPGSGAAFDLDVPDDCDLGNVDTGSSGGGSPYEALTANGDTGEDSTVRVTAGQPVSLAVLSPPTPAGLRHWVLWIFDGAASTPTPVQATLNNVARNLGTACRCLPSNNTVTPNSCACPGALAPQPRGYSSKSFAGAGAAARFCLSRNANVAAYPYAFSVTFPRGTYTLVGLIQDGASPNSVPISVLNQITVVAQ